MSVRLSQITVADDSTDSYVGHRPRTDYETDVLALRRLNVPIADRLVLSAVRYELREGHPRSRSNPWSGIDCLPSVKGLIVTTDFDDFGSNIFADIEYDSRGHRATYGGHFDREANVIRWTCYMD